MRSSTLPLSGKRSLLPPDAPFASRSSSVPPCAPGRLGAAIQPLAPLHTSASRAVRLAPPRAAAVEEPPAVSARDRSHETDIVVIGSGIGGLSAGAILAKYGYKVTVVESHYHPGGAAHEFIHKDETGSWHFEAGPSFHAGISLPKGQSNNPLKQVLDALDESVDCVSYDNWNIYLPEGKMVCRANAESYASEIKRLGGDAALRAWRAIEAEVKPLGDAAALLPASALRFDAGVVVTAGKFGPGLLTTGLAAPTLTGAFSKVVDRHCPPGRSAFLRNLMDLECFVLSGVPARDTICAEMAFMLSERNGGKCPIDYPMGGTASIVKALIRGLEKHGGRLVLRAHVEEVLVEEGRATGVRLRGSKGEVIRARKAVVSNASTWDTQKLLPPSVRSAATGRVKSWTDASNAVKPCGSFMHLHLGIDATGLPKDLDCHHVVVRSWEKGVEAEQNVILTSIPSVFDPSLAPPGHHVIHTYCAANESYDRWAGLKPGSAEYESLKEERSQELWKALERVIPDVRERTKVKLVGTPLTHERFLRRHRGSYGPAVSAGGGESFPGPFTPIPGLFVCGDSCQPGIGVPAAAASGMICANSLSLSHVGKQLRLMEEIAGRV